MPPTPEFHGFDELRRSIHPAGPRSANMMHTTSLYPLSLTFDRAGGYVYPNTPQRVNHDGNVFPDTPASPMTSPAYVPPSVRGSVSETDPSYETEQQYEQVQEHYHDDHALQFPDQGEGKDVQSSGPMRPVDRDEYLSGFRPGVDYSRLNY
jgi:hypothetical protein